MHETGHESPKLIMYLSFTLIMLVRSSASNKFVIQKMTPRKKYYKNSCNNENISTESIEEDVLDKIYDPNIDLWTGYTTCTCMTKYIEELTNTTRLLKYNNLFHTQPKHACGDSASPLLPLFPYFCGHSKQLLLRQGKF